MGLGLPLDLSSYGTGACILSLTYNREVQIIFLDIQNNSTHWLGLDGKSYRNTGGHFCIKKIFLA